MAKFWRLVLIDVDAENRTRQLEGMKHLIYESQLYEYRPVGLVFELPANLDSCQASKQASTRFSDLPLPSNVL